MFCLFEVLELKDVGNSVSNMYIYIVLGREVLT